MDNEFLKHNAEVKRVWDAYNAGRPIRVPMIIGANPRMILLDPKLNPEKITFKEYFNDPDIMLGIQMKFQAWQRTNLLQDAPMGVPEEGLPVTVDVQNVCEAAWLGADINFRDGQVPDTEPILAGDKKEALFNAGIPDMFSGIMKKKIEYFEFFKEKQRKGYCYQGIPIREVLIGGAGTDGVLTGAVNLRGVEILTDFYEDPEYVRKLFAFLTKAIILRIKAFRKYLGEPEKSKSIWFADDSIATISTEMYKEFVLPFHKQLVTELSEGGPNAIHLCGDATRHFKLIRDELNVFQFDTGFPVDFKWLRKELGRGIEIYGGPKISLLLNGSVDEVEAETKRILQTGIMDGGKFVIREGNNLAPRTPLDNIKKMYEVVKEHGRYNT